MKRFNTHVGTLDRPFQQRPEVFHSVRVNVAVNIAFRVIDYLVCVFVVQSIVREKLISHDLGTLADVLANKAGKFPLAPRGDVVDADLSGIAFEQSKNDLFAAWTATANLFFALVLVHEACRATDEGLSASTVPDILLIDPV
jgi:hypothetical protein